LPIHLHLHIISAEAVLVLKNKNKGKMITIKNIMFNPLNFIGMEL